MIQPIDNTFLEQNSHSLLKPKKKVKKIIKRKPKLTIAEEPPKNSEVAYRSDADFRTLEELSAIVRDIHKAQNKICLTKKEKKCLEEITKLATKTNAPLDDRLLHFYKQDFTKFTTPIIIPEETVKEKELAEAVALTKQAPGEITATCKLNTYLTSLKNLIAKREIAWASAQDWDYHQKGEITRLKSENNHLRVVCSKRQTTITEKEKIIQEKEKKINSLEKFIKELKKEILHLAKNDEVLPESGLIADSKETKTILKPPGVHLRRNFGPAALLANGLNKARNAGI